MQSLSRSGTLTFRVSEEAEGGYSAIARVGNYSMVTQGDDLDELRRMIQQLVDDFNLHEAGQIKRISCSSMPAGSRWPHGQDSARSDWPAAL